MLDNPFIRFYGIVLTVGGIVSLITILIGRRAKKRFVKYIMPSAILVLAGGLYAASLFAKESMQDLAFVVMGWLVFLIGAIGIITAVIYDFILKNRKRA
jgi:uncharacterized membrane protein HdeD (DUF308 family)